MQRWPELADEVPRSLSGEVFYSGPPDSLSRETETGEDEGSDEGEG